MQGKRKCMKHHGICPKEAKEQCVAELVQRAVLAVMELGENSSDIVEAPAKGIGVHYHPLVVPPFEELMTKDRIVNQKSSQRQ
jgi:hypothetical protein